jgi:cysteine desulfurase
MRPIYFDYNSTTPLDASVREVMLPFLGEVFGNPSSVHRVGQRARAMLDDARERVASVWQCKPSEVTFTSGGTESNNLAILGTARRNQAKGRHLITSTIEHHAVLHCFDYLARKEGFEVTYLPVTAEGFVSVESLANAIRRDTILVSIMAANNEIGTIQPIAQLGALCRDHRVLFHTDAVQCFGKEPFLGMAQFNADLVSACAHKFHGPKGAGALFVRSPLQFDPILFGGAQENERRAGTENLAGVAGFAEATSRFIKEPVFPKELLSLLNRRLAHFFGTLPGVVVRSPGINCLSNTITITVEGCDSLSLLAALDMEGICASSGSACTSGSLQPSHVLLAMGLDHRAASSLIRFSLGRDSTSTEIDTLEHVLPPIISRARGL